MTKNKFNYLLVFTWLSIAFMASCSSTSKQPLPILGKMKADFSFVNQDSQVVTNQDFQDKIYVTDFFFTSCPTICPIMKSQMIRVHDKFKDQDDFILLSHSIDPNDSVAVLSDYAQKLGIQSKNWMMVTGKKEKIYEMAKHYMTEAGADMNAPGGYIHSGAFVLLDKQQRIRGFYDGTKKEEVDNLLQDIEKLLNEGEK